MKILIQVSHKEARDYLLAHERYCPVKLPGYINFNTVLRKISEKIGDNDYKTYYHDRKNNPPSNYNDVNFTLYSNKDGNLSWRAFELINPFLYVALVHLMTRKENWETITNKLKEKINLNSQRISVTGIPIYSKKQTKKNQILKWWKDTEKYAISKSIEYNHCIITDIANCYPSMYTHAIDWAISGFDVAKNNRDKNRLGSQIDILIQSMRHGQTNGIPIAGTLTDLIAEIILIEIDCDILKETNQITDFHIIRYRDDYRVFFNNPNDGKKILQIISSSIRKYGLSLNSSKTKFLEDIGIGQLKADKVNKLMINGGSSTLYSRALKINMFAISNKNSNQINALLKAFNKHISSFKDKKIRYKEIHSEEKLALIGIFINILHKNPSTVAAICQILTKLFFNLNNAEIIRIIKNIKSKMELISDTEISEIWLQRIAIPIQLNLEYRNKISKIISKHECQLWNNDWLKKNMKDIINEPSFVNWSIIERLPKIIENHEVDDFESYPTT